MENNQTAQPEQSAVTISKAEYDQLKSQAASAQTPAYEAAPVVHNPGAATLEPPKTSTSDYVWFVLGAFVLASFLIPGGWFFFAPILLFALVASRGIFKDSTNHSKPVKGVMLAFKIIAVLMICAFVAFGAFVAFIIAMLSTGDAHMD